MIEVTPNMYTIGMICFYFSMINFLALVYMIIQYEANKRSTHSIEYRDPFTNYSTDNQPYEEIEEKENKLKEETEEKQDFDKMNKFIKDNEVIL